MKKNIFLLATLIIIQFSCDTKKKAIITAEPQIVEKNASRNANEAKNIIFMVGDGMGIRSS